MKASEIEEGIDYHYERKMGARLHKGKGQVERVTHKTGHGGGWFIVLQDTDTKEVHKLRPAHLLRRVKLA